MWIKLSTNGKSIWANTALVRWVEEDYSHGAKLVHTSKASTKVDQSLEEVMIAMGYDPPPKPPIETHSTGDVTADASFVPAGEDTYLGLTKTALAAAKHPLTTQELIDFMEQRRDVNPSSVRSTLQKSDEVRRVAWKGADAWWLSNATLPVQ